MPIQRERDICDKGLLAKYAPTNETPHYLRLG